jgi:hypothetical protein
MAATELRLSSLVRIRHGHPDSASHSSPDGLAAREHLLFDFPYLIKRPQLKNRPGKFVGQEKVPIRRV